MIRLYLPLFMFAALIASCSGGSSNSGGDAQLEESNGLALYLNLYETVLTKAGASEDEVSSSKEELKKIFPEQYPTEESVTASLGLVEDEVSDEEKEALLEAEKKSLRRELAVAVANALADVSSENISEVLQYVTLYSKALESVFEEVMEATSGQLSAEVSEEKFLSAVEKVEAIIKEFVDVEESEAALNLVLEEDDKFSLNDISSLLSACYVAVKTKEKVLKEEGLYLNFGSIASQLMRKIGPLVAKFGSDSRKVLGQKLLTTLSDDVVTEGIAAKFTAEELEVVKKDVVEAVGKLKSAGFLDNNFEASDLEKTFDNIIAKVGDVCIWSYPDDILSSDMGVVSATVSVTCKTLLSRYETADNLRFARGFEIDFSGTINGVKLGRGPNARAVSDGTLNMNLFFTANDFKPIETANMVITLKEKNFEDNKQPADGTHVLTISKTKEVVSPVLSYTVNGFTETSADDGSLGSGNVAVSVASGEFAVVGTLERDTHYTITNVPAGLTPVVTSSSKTAATLTFTGNADDHGSGDGVTGELEFTKAAFKANVAPTSATASREFTITFIDTPTVTYSFSNFTEAGANDGSISTPLTATISNGTWASDFAPADAVLSGTALPSGLSAVVSKVSDTVVTISLSGSTTPHAMANSVSGIVITFSSDAFTDGLLPVNGSETTTVGINFSDSSIIMFSAGTYNGNLTNRAFADNECATADTSGSSNVKAFISFSAMDEIQDLNPPAGVAIKSGSDVTIAGNWAALLDASSTDIDSSLVAAGIIDPMGGSLNWWSGSNDDGSFDTSFSCSGWTSDSSMDNGMTGIGGDTGVTWMDSGFEETCDNMHHLICIAY